MVHVDLAGPMSVESLGGARYAMLVVDAATRLRMLYPLRAKSQVPKYMEECEADMRALLDGRSIKALRTDNGGEFISSALSKWCKQRGILQTFTAPHASQQNGLAERSIRTVMNMTRCLLEQSGLDKRFWAEAMNTAVYLINRLPTAALDGDTPYHAAFGKHARMDHLRMFGCLAYVHVYDGQRKKIDPKAWRGILVGYDPHNRTCYRVYDPSTGTVKRSVHVSFDEKVFPAKIGLPAEIKMPSCVWTSPSVGDDEAGSGQDGGGQDHGGNNDGNNGGNGGGGDYEQEERVWKWSQQVEQQAGNLGRAFQDGRYVSRRGKEQPQHAHVAIDHALAAAEAMSGDPSSYKEAMKSPDATKWKGAADEEYNSLLGNGTWTVCKLPPGANAIGSRWVFKTKRDETGEIVRYKARFVAQGFSQVPGQDYLETYAPVAKLSSIRTVLSIAAAKGLVLRQADVVTAFLQSPVTEEIYVKQPEGYEQYGPNGEELVCRLHKSLYGLKQSPRNWHHVFDKWLKEYGLKPCDADPCVYVLIYPSGEMLILTVYVDDVVVAGGNPEIVERFLRAMAGKFDIKDLGQLKWLLGMDVKITELAAAEKSKKRAIEIEIHQTAYIDRVAEHYGMAKCKSASTPAEGILPRYDHGKPDSEYRSLVGSLMYAAMVTRPDIAYAVQALARHLNAPGPEHWVAAKRVLRYLRGTRDLGIKYGPDGSSHVVLHGYADADWAGDPYTRRSTTGYVFMISGGCVSWMSKLQPTVALSSAEAEYMAVCAAVQEAIHMRSLLRDLGCQQDQPTIIFEDNQGCIALSENPVHHKRTKHIEIRYHFTRERVESGEVVLKYVATEHQLADMLTKALHSYRMSILRNRTLGYKSE
jgi:hypothetical protein